jgi:hypothetical protein
MNIIAAGVALAVMHALPTPGCSYRCMLEQPRARLGHPMHFDMEIEYRGSEAQGSIATSDQDIVLPEYRSLRLLHPPRRGIPGYTTAPTEIGCIPPLDFMWSALNCDILVPKIYRTSTSRKRGRN